MSALFGATHAGKFRTKSLYYYIRKASLNQKTLAGFLAKQKRMGHALVDIIVKVYSHSFKAIIARSV